MLYSKMTPPDSGLKKNLNFQVIFYKNYGIWKASLYLEVIVQTRIGTVPGGPHHATTP